MSQFKSYREFKTVRRFGNNGEPITVTEEVDRWSREAGINFLRANGKELTQSAVRDGWHTHLLSFVQYRHRLPSMAECEELVLDFQKVEAATPHSVKRPEILEKRKRLAADLSTPLSLKATG